MTENPVDESLAVKNSKKDPLDLYLLPKMGFRDISLLSDSKLLIHESMNSRTKI